MLIGKDGERRTLVDSHGREVGRPKDGNTPAIPGKTLKLTNLLPMFSVYESEAEAMKAFGG